MISNETATYLGVALIACGLVYVIIFFLLKRLGKSPKNILPVNVESRTRVPLILLLVSLFLQVVSSNREKIGEFSLSWLVPLSRIMLIASITWLAVIAVRIFKTHVLSNYDINTENNFSARKVYTQFTILERVAVFLIIFLGIGITLMSFDSIREIGVSVLTSAGIAGIIIGFAAQKALGTLLAGIQIAITQPIRIDDVVIVEGEWGRIEEIFLTYVVVKIWDKRRLVLPTTYFIENTFQNWTRNSSDILGTIFIYTDYNVPFDALRKEQTRILKTTDLWDGEVDIIQVTESKPENVEIRSLVSAKDSPTAWDLRVLVREQLITFIQQNYPDSLPRTRVEMLHTENGQKDKTAQKTPLDKEEKIKSESNQSLKETEPNKA